jgi:hypothetical protein
MNEAATSLLIGGASPNQTPLLNIIAPGYKLSERIRATELNRERSIPPKSVLSFSIRVPYKFGQPGVYRLNISYKKVDSNTLEFDIR